MRALWPWERHNVSEPLFSYIENVDNTCPILLSVVKIKWKSSLKNCKAL